ncbi:hypothetical protein BSKO_12742 [Bryopsis sp. KO-2023]|nr:hypothetical protein BSKO_12742 [Bryopsis sp. KO-2023]
MCPPRNAANILKAYRELLILTKRLPTEKIGPAWREATETVRAHKNETDPQKISDLYRQMVSKIGVLRMMTPRVRGDRERFNCAPGTYVLRDGELVHGEGEPLGSRVADGKVSMEEAKHVHHKLLKRQYFGREPPKNPAGLF